MTLPLQRIGRSAVPKIRPKKLPICKLSSSRWSPRTKPSEKIGEEAANNYWLLVQHADAHKDFQAKLLPELKRAADEGDASKVNYAYLYDRVMVGAGKPQRYGTQGGGCENGKIKMRPVDDPAGLAQRRKELHLMPMEQYVEILSSMCSKEAAPSGKTTPQH